MKKHLLVLVMIICITSYAMAQSPVLYGTTSYGGIGGYAGTLFKMNPDGSGFNVQHNFQSPDGYVPMGNLIQASDGNLYGCCHEGGDYLSCTIYRYNLSSNTYEDVWDFDITNGDFPKSGVVQGPSGKLWGAAFSGGTSASGVIYSYEISTDTYTAEHSFNDGMSPYACPILIGNKLFGTTLYDATNFFGIIYSYDVTNGTYVMEHAFDSINGFAPYGGLFEASNGKLYGMASAGGLYGNGIVYSYEIGTSTFTKIHDFTTAEGTMPQGEFVEDANGKIYGMTYGGGTNSKGTIFTIDISNNNFVKVHDFDGTNGSSPKGTLTFDQPSGLFYGMTYNGGAGNMGVAFKFNPIGNVLTRTFEFNSTDGSNPNGAMTFITPLAGIQPISQMQVDVYPNPATDHFTVSIPDPLESKVVFQLLNEEGKVVLSWKENMIAGNYMKLVDINNLSSGTYMLEINSGQSKMVKKIIK